MKPNHLLLLLIFPVIANAFGCAQRQPEEPTFGPIPANSFQRQWGATLDLARDRDSAERLFLRSDLLLLYTKQNRVYAFAADSGELLWTNRVADAGSSLRPPTVMGERIVIPTISSLEVYNRAGRKLESISLERPTRSPAAAEGNFLYIGIDYARGGRLAKMDLSQAYGRVIWELMNPNGAFTSGPAIFEDVIYAATTDGLVYAVDEDSSPIWSIEGQVFAAEGPIVADLKVDDFGLYVPSSDSKLYCLDRNSGRIKWTYHAPSPLRSPAIAIADRVYQLVPGHGLVAINKTEGESMRKPLWLAPAARQFLASDAGHVYVHTSDGAVTALDREKGQPRFRSGRTDLSVTAVNPAGSLIYVATRNGEILALQPVLKPGTVGQMVWNSGVRSGAPG